MRVGDLVRYNEFGREVVVIPGSADMVGIIIDCLDDDHGTWWHVHWNSEDKVIRSLEPTRLLEVVSPCPSRERE